MNKVILIISDTHGRKKNITDALKKVGKVDYVFFLGDVIRDYEETDFGSTITSAVRGNCDFGCNDYPQTIVFELFGHRILLCHGDTLRVKYGIDYLVKYCKENNIDIALYGHTHIRDNRMIDGVHVFNPGSLSEPREGPKSFGVLTIDDKGNYLFSHGELNGFLF